MQLQRKLSADDIFSQFDIDFISLYVLFLLSYGVTFTVRHTMMAMKNCIFFVFDLRRRVRHAHSIQPAGVTSDRPRVGQISYRLCHRRGTYATSGAGPRLELFQVISGVAAK